MDAEVGREPQYDLFADEFLGHAQRGFYNAYYCQPACLALLGDVTGKRILDAACGPGLYAAELIGRGRAGGGVRPQPADGGDLPGPGKPGRVPRARPE
jgi:hypothetical protein